MADQTVERKDTQALAQALQARKFQSLKQRARNVQESQQQKKQQAAAVAKAKAKKTSERDKRFKVIDMALKKQGHSQDALIEILHKVQETFGFLDDEVLEYVTRQMKLPLSVVYGVATFYHIFSLKPQGEHNCVVCLGTACYVKGAGEILEKLENYLEIKTGETTADGKMSLLTARCMGACGIAPAFIVDGKVLGKQTTESILAAIQDLMDSGKADEIKEKVEELTAVS